MGTDVSIQRTRQCGCKTGDVRSSLLSEDVVDIGEQVFRIGVIPLQSHLKGDDAVVALFFSANVDRFGKERNLIFIQKGDKRRKPAFKREDDIFMRILNLINIGDLEPGIEESKLSKAF